MFSRACYLLHGFPRITLAACFPRLLPAAWFPAHDIDCIFSDAWHRLHVLLRLLPAITKSCFLISQCIPLLKCISFACFDDLNHSLSFAYGSCSFVSRLCAILVLLVNVTYSMLFTHRHWSTVLLRSMLVYPGAQRWLPKQQGNTFLPGRSVVTTTRTSWVALVLLCYAL